MNAPVLVDVEGETDPLQIAIKELREKKIPLCGDIYPMAGKQLKPLPTPKMWKTATGLLTNR